MCIFCTSLQKVNTPLINLHKMATNTYGEDDKDSDFSRMPSIIESEHTIPEPIDNPLTMST